MKNNRAKAQEVEEVVEPVTEETQPQFKNIFILTYSKDNTLSEIYVNSLATTIRMAAFNGIRVFPVIVGQVDNPMMAKNELLNIVRSDNFVAAVFVNPDLAWDPISLLEICLHEEDAIALPVVKKLFNNVVFDLDIDMDNINKNDDGFIEVRYASTGMLKLSKNLVDALLDGSLSVTNNTGNEVKNVFECAIKDGKFFNESIVLCDKIKEMGYTVWLNPKRTCGQVADNIYAVDFAEAFEKQTSMPQTNTVENMKIKREKEDTDDIKDLYS